MKDHLGSTRAVVDNNGAVLETFDYYPFGLLMPKRNTAGANTIEKFTGKERDTEGNLNLDYFGARYYDAALGRWHGVDPLADAYSAWSPYNYTLNNPINYADPTGLCPEDGSAGENQFGPGYCMEAVVVTAKRPDFHNDYQGHNRFFRIGGEFALWGYGMRNLGTKPYNVTIFRERSSGEYYGAYTDWRYNTGIAPVPGAKKLVKARSIDPHLLLRMTQRGVTEKMIDTAIKKGEKLWDPKNKSIIYILKDGFASGKSLLVARNPITGNVKTVIRGNYNKLKSSRFESMPVNVFE